MLLLLHGNQTVRSRQVLVDTITKAKTQGLTDITRFLGPSLTLNGLTVAAESASMFTSNRLIIIENLFLLKSKTMLASVLKYMVGLNQATSHLIIWESKLLTAAQIKSLPQFTVQLFKASKVTYKALDELKPNHQTLFLPLFEEAYQKDTPEFVFFMLVRHLRLLLTVSSAKTAIPVWQANKLIAQAKLLGGQNLLTLHVQLTDLDWRLKTGQIVSTLQSELNYILSKVI